MLPEKVKSFIQKEKLLHHSSKILVGVSGGSDSMVLLEILRQLNYSCFVAHMNFSLRGKESDDDEAFVRDFARQIPFPFYTKKVDTLEHAKSKGISMEMAARELRYDFFDQLLEQHKIDVIAVGHHKNDVAETMLINLTRGTGVRGLSGIQAKMGKVIRPLLDISNEAILKYSKENKIPYRVDQSNTDTRIKRNNFRHNIIPKFEQINPSFIQTMADTAHRMQQVQKLIDNVVSGFTSEHVINNRGNKYILLDGLLNHPSRSVFLFEILNPFGYNTSQLDEINNALEKTPGKTWYTNTHRLILSATHLILQERDEEPEIEALVIQANCRKVDSPLALTISAPLALNDCTLNFSNTNVFFDAEKIHFPLTLRKWRQGDWFIPFGMKGTKKLSDFFIDNKLSLVEKEEVYVLVSGEDIIWILGYRTDERYKITKETKSVIQIEWNKQAANS